jgi:branched-chain amino acid transport system substrate-binding protein
VCGSARIPANRQVGNPQEESYRRPAAGATPHVVDSTGGGFVGYRDFHKNIARLHHLIFPVQMERTSVEGGRPGRLRGIAFPAAAALLLLGSACGRSDNPVVFGAAGPLEASYGASMRQGAELAQQEVNAGGGIRGRPLELRFRDDGADPQAAPAIAEAFFEDPQVVAVVGHVNSGTMTAAAFIYQQGLPAVATSATSPGISRLGEWIFRVASSDSANAVALARHARGFATPTAILYENDDYGRGLADSFRSALSSAGTRVVSSDPYLDSTEDLMPYLHRLRRMETGLVFIAGLEEGASRIIRQAQQVGLGARFLGGDGVEGLVEMGSEFDGTRVGLLFHPDASPASRAFAERFRASYGREPDSFAALGYDATHLLARAATQAGPSRRAIRDYLAAVGREGGREAFEGVTGTIRFDRNGDPEGKAFAVGVIRNGSIQLDEGL